ncbi:hypothetical protein M422DRAFT_28656 [Sphaerobolus stellatus SS14]|uniref:Uncharacterized protein n=1 Tax=Sphaerobolus stellatus (strain SS14) TaxID=990650 RepID=A0A0C9UW07_SPHS4|nr:hypothetical protein M422DRAFT_28656 [Sphaerobolus stellatus SS14]
MRAQAPSEFEVLPDDDLSNLYAESCLRTWHVPVVLHGSSSLHSDDQNFYNVHI